MPQVRFKRTLRVPADSAAEALGKTLKAISDQEGPWRDFALHIRLGDFRLPDVGYVAVPIRLSQEKHPERARVFEISFKAANMPDAFPGFNGTLGVEESGSLGESVLYLEGVYEVPMHFFGKLLDAALTPGVANRSLENFLEDIAAASEASVNRREAEFARYHFYAQPFR